MSTAPTVSIDYIRIATFDFKVYCDLAAAVRRKFVGWRSSRWLQYKMERSQDNVSYGIGEQSRRKHGIFEASGVDAHIFTSWLLETQGDYLHALYATRIDLQATQQPPKAFSYLKAHKSIKKPKQLILGDDGNTLYVGNRESNTFWRVYDKAEGQVRVEVELKNDQAKKAFVALKCGESPAALYDYYLAKSRIPTILVRAYIGGNDPKSPDDLRARVPKDLEKTMLWLASLDELMYKMANDHDYGDRTRNLIRRWAEYGQNIDTQA